jgi:hypothetical protein
MLALAMAACSQQPEIPGVPITRNSIDGILDAGSRGRSWRTAWESDTRRAFDTERKADIAVEYTADRKMDINVGPREKHGEIVVRNPRLFEPDELIPFFDGQRRKGLVVVMFHKNTWTDDEENMEVARMNAYFRDRGYKRIVIQQFRAWGRPTLSDIRS